MGRLDGKVAFITGVARGQGRSHALRLASEGADIIGVDICADIPSNEYPMATREELDETVALVEALDRRVHASVADVRDYHQLSAALDAGVAELGRLDIVCVNAGIAGMAFRPLTIDEELEAFGDVIGVNLTGAFHTVRAAMAHLVDGGRGGSIILTSSTAGLRGFTGDKGGGLGYAASKHGVVGLMRTLANALAPHSIRVNTVHPSGVNTMMVSNPAMAAFLADNPDRGLHLENALPIDVLQPEDISAAVAFLASDDAKYITGVTLPVDAGFCNRVG